MRPQKHVSRAPPCRRNMLARALCITISDDRGDESFADDLNMGRGIVSGRVALLLRSTEIRPHRPNDLLPPKKLSNSRVAPFPHSTLNTWPKKRSWNCPWSPRDWASRRDTDAAGHSQTPRLARARVGTPPRGGTLSNSRVTPPHSTLHTWPKKRPGYLLK